MLNNEKYTRNLSRRYPGLFVILLDQSISMTEQEQETGKSKAFIATAYVNSTIKTMIDNAQIDEFTGKHKNYAYVCILGYNDTVYPLLSSGFAPISITDLADMAKGKTFVERAVFDASGGLVRRVRQEMPLWIEPGAAGNTDMAYAFEEAEKVIHNWLASPPELISKEMGWEQPRSKAFPPVLINITDAMHNGPGNPEDVAERIRRMGTEDGNVLIYNCHFTHERMQPCIFPKDLNEVRSLTQSRLAERMFYMSSEIPEALRTKATRIMRMPIASGSRCFVYNANPDILLKFLQSTTLSRF